MPAPYIQVAVHFVWSTWDRLPLMPPAVLPRMHAAIAAKCRELGCAPLAIGGTVDHTHALIGMKAACSISDVAQAAKGYSSYLMTHEFAPGEFFKWQGSYGAIAVAHADIERIQRYVRNQARHHGEHSLLSEFEKTTCEAR